MHLLIFELFDVGGGGGGGGDRVSCDLEVQMCQLPISEGAPGQDCPYQLARHSSRPRWGAAYQSIGGPIVSWVLTFSLMICK